MTKKAVSENRYLPCMLVILDGFGHNANTPHNAIAQAHTPNLDFLYTHYPHTLLAASGTAVGLNEGDIGNSEVGHMTIGAGRVVLQPVRLIDQAIADGSFFSNPTLTKLLDGLAATKKALHIIGLLSDTHVHSSLAHLFAFIKAAHEHKVRPIIIHPILDGRDSPAQSAQLYLTQLEKVCKEYPEARIGSIAGRFYAMDRDANWDRIAHMYTMLTQLRKPVFHTWSDALRSYYEQKETDEFIPPTLLDENAPITSGDGIIFFNFRADRARQLTQAFTDKTFAHFSQTVHPAFFLTPVNYADFLDNNVMFSLPIVNDTLKQVLCENKLSICCLSETEKYAHVTYFFSGRKEDAFACETDIHIPSLRNKTYIDSPCMRAPEITKTVVNHLHKDAADFYIINYANADMVGHSGDMSATIKAIECLDEQLGILYQEINARAGTLYITADHGNAELMVDPKTGLPHTAHTHNPVPFIFVRPDVYDASVKLPLKQLCDIAPFILKNLHIKIPAAMQ